MGRCSVAGGRPLGGAGGLRLYVGRRAGQERYSYLQVGGQE